MKSSTAGVAEKNPGVFYIEMGPSGASPFKRSTPFEKRLSAHSWLGSEWLNGCPHSEDSCGSERLFAALHSERLPLRLVMWLSLHCTHWEHERFDSRDFSSTLRSWSHKILLQCFSGSHIDITFVAVTCISLHILSVYSIHGNFWNNIKSWKSTNNHKNTRQSTIYN